MTPPNLVSSMHELRLPTAIEPASPSKTCCPVCYSGLQDVYSGPERADIFLAGEVFSVQESIYTPIEHILADPEISGLIGAEANDSRTSLVTFQTRARATLKSRPGILMRQIIHCPFDQIENAIICVMTTLNGLQYENLPEIVRFFGILVYPNLVPMEDGSARFHLHTLPAWPKLKQNRYQLIIAYKFLTTRKLDERWWTPEAYRGKSTTTIGGLEGRDPALFRSSICERQGMSFGKHAMAQLRERCDELRDEWIQKCNDNHAFAVECEREYRAWQNLESQLDDRSFMGDVSTKRSRSLRSQASVARRRAPPTRGPEGSVLQATIFEDQESVFHVTQEVSADTDARGWEVQGSKKERYHDFPNHAGGSDALLTSQKRHMRTNSAATDRQSRRSGSSGGHRSYVENVLMGAGKKGRSDAASGKSTTSASRSNHSERSRSRYSPLGSRFSVFRHR
ncbi:hypothetical protein FKP32DRAFT_261245 [Trametes sanguinea]|nr:hypothetical protein FKP32DRAFT_261245 [Trametes sanguinea]